MDQNLAQVLDLLHDVQLPAQPQIDAFDLLVEIVIPLVDFRLFTDELNNLQFFYLLLIIGIKNLNLVPLVYVEVLHNRLLISFRVLLLEIDPLDHDSVGIM